MVEKRDPELYGDGNQAKDFTFVADIVQANLLASLSSSDGEIFNIGSGSKTTINNLVRIIEKTTTKRQNRTPTFSTGRCRGDSRMYRKSKQTLGYAPKVSLEQGIQACFDWYQKDEIDFAK